MNTHVETEAELDERTDAEAMALDKAMVTVALKTRKSPFADRVKEPSRTISPLIPLGASGMTCFASASAISTSPAG